VFRRRLVLGVLATTLGASGLFVATAASAGPGDFGFQDQSTVGAGTVAGELAPTADKPESKLWYADGLWWADMWDTISSQHHIFQLNRATEQWTDTGVVLDQRASTQSDTLWDGSHLYVSSHVIADDSAHAIASNPAYFYRYTLTSGTWSLDTGFPVAIEDYSVESLTIAEDSQDTMFATWTRGKQVYIAATTTRADATTVAWDTPFVPSVPGTATTVEADDISAVVAYEGNKTMVLWSNQVTPAVYYATHDDSADATPTTGWTGGVAASGALIADDHINLKTFQSDPSGHVYAAVKTSRNDAASPVPTDPLMRLLVFTPGTSTWASYTFSTVADSETRPIVELDPTDNTLHMFVTGPSAPSSSQVFHGTIYEKTTSLSSPHFVTGPGTPVIRDAASDWMNNATGTKQSVDASTGLVVLASNEATSFYWHMDEALNVAPVADFTETPTSGTASLQVQFTDHSPSKPTSWLWDFGDGTTSTAQDPLHSFTTAGTYSVTLQATNTFGSSPVSPPQSITVAAPAPVASFTEDHTSGTAPLAVQFTDTSTSTPTSWLWTFGDGTTSTIQDPLHSFTTAGTYLVTLQATNGSGSSPVSPSQSITVSAAVSGSTGGSGGSGGGGGGGGGGGDPGMSRLSGADRFGTAVAISQASFPNGGAGAVVLARGDDYPDALVGASLAAAKNAPVLLTVGDALSSDTATELQRVLAPGGTVYILGGLDSVPDSVATQVTALGYTVVRYAGANRFATAVQVADALNDPSTVLLASGTNFPDALSAGAAAAKVGGVVLLTDGTTLPAETSAYLAAHATKVYAIGGPAAAADSAATPLVGTNRYETSLDVAQLFFSMPGVLGFASGEAFPDALAGAALLAHEGAPLILTAPTALPAVVDTYLVSLTGTSTTTYIFGGDNAVSTAVQAAIATAPQ
jgi:PKD repeat protein